MQDASNWGASAVDVLGAVALVLIGIDADPLHVARSDVNNDSSAGSDDIHLFVTAELAP